MKKHSLLFTLSISTLIGACVTADDASDPTAAEPTSTIASNIIGGTCAVNWQSNGTITASGGTSPSYVRTSHEINQTCDCAEWQVEDNTDPDHNMVKTCRTATFVELSTLQGQPYRFYAEVPDWGITDETECGNSTLAMRLDELNSATNQFEQVWPSNGTAWSSVASWNPTTHTCRPLTGVSFQSPQWGGVSIGGPKYRVRAVAVRGLNQFNHGFAGVSIHAVLGS